MLFLASLRRRGDPPDDPAPFPWSLPLVRNLDQLTFTTPVTFLVGENGSGKSTLLEGIATGIEAVAAGSRDLQRDPTLTAARTFAAGFVFSRRRHARTRLFLCAEDVFGYTGRLTADLADLADIERDLAQLPEGPGRQRATAMARGQRRSLWIVTVRIRIPDRMVKRSSHCCRPTWYRTACIFSMSRKPRCRQRACWR